MRIMITGASGQLGRALGIKGHSHELKRLSSAQLDIRDPVAVKESIAAFRPEVVINAAAYTAVDRAEEEEGAAFEVNATGVKNIAEGVKSIDARMIHVSTDFVFGEGHSSPLTPDCRPQPVSAYGRSKLAGEIELAKVLEPESFLILRTAWLYSSGSGNFVTTMLRLMEERPEIGVVSDQLGTPTSVVTLADVIFELIELKASGTHHVTDAGVASWYDFAVAIQDLGAERGLVNRATKLTPIRTEDYPTPAKRPNYSVLDKASLIALLGHGVPYWRHSLAACLDEIS